MGVDIYGRMPKIVSERPEQIDFKSSIDDEKQDYWNKEEEWEAKNPGIYFCSNWWAWKLIHTLCEMAIEKYSLKMNMRYWDSYNGNGLRSQKQCGRLADAIELMLNNDPIYKDFVTDNSNVIYIVKGCWVEPANGRFYSDESTDLHEQYDYGTILWAPIVTKKGVLVESAHSCSLDHIKGWINFLRECGGFKIW